VQVIVKLVTSVFIRINMPLEVKLNVAVCEVLSVTFTAIVPLDKDSIMTVALFPGRSEKLTSWVLLTAIDD